MPTLFSAVRALGVRTLRIQALRSRARAWPLMLVVVGWVSAPFVPFTVLGNADLALLYAIVAVSLVLLTGWVGQISLAQAAFVGIGAFGTAFLYRIGAPLPFPFSLPAAAALAGGAAMALGVVALRIRGLYLAVATLIFAWVADQYLFSAPWFAGGGGAVSIEATTVGKKGGFPSFDLSDRRQFYYVGLAVLVLAVMAFVNLRQSKTGRAFFAIRGSEMAAASLGIDVTRYKLLAFALSGFVAGMAGNLVITSQGAIVADQFNFTTSIFYLAVAVVGGLHSLGGAIASSVLFAFLNELFFRVDVLAGWLEVVSATLLAVVVLFYPGGLAAASLSLHGVWRRRSASRAQPVEGDEVAGSDEVAPVHALQVETGPEALDVTAEILVATNGDNSEVKVLPDEVPDMLANLRPADFEQLKVLAASATANGKDLPRAGLGRLGGSDRVRRFELPKSRNRRELVLSAEEVTVRFGGLVAVDAASLEVREGEIVGLIGANGAGKTTFFNAMAGFVQPQEGRFEFNGRDITSLPVHERARSGIGRTFQLIQLFPQLTVFENMLVATHVRNKSGFLAHLVVTTRAALLEAEAMERVEKVVALLGLGDVADRRVTGLPFGTLRIVELGRALVTGSPLVMLDEPASGLDSKETEAFRDLLLYLRATLGLTLLLIEHDVGLVMSVCDYVYVLDRGKLIARGTPAEVRNDSAVMAAYLGTGGGPAKAPSKKSRSAVPMKADND